MTGRGSTTCRQLAGPGSSRLPSGPIVQTRLVTSSSRIASSGDALISPSITVRLLRQVTALNAGAGRPPAEPLTNREMDIAGLVAQGLTNAEIAAALVITAGTVKTHVANIARKLRVRNRVGIAAWAWDNGYPVR